MHVQNGQTAHYYVSDTTQQQEGRSSYPNDRCDIRQRYDMQRDVNENSVQQTLVACDNYKTSKNTINSSDELESHHVLDIYCRFLFPFLYGLAMLIYFVYMTNQPTGPSEYHV